MSFLSDSKALATLERQILPELFARDPSAAIRAWVPACGSGEDAYAIAILLNEHVERKGLANDLRVFATDSNSSALEAARAGLFPNSVASGVSEARLRRYFRAEPGGFRVSKRIRDCVLFSKQDLLTDPPFSKLDLILGGPLFTDLSAEAQSELIQVFHYALLPRGWLLLRSGPIPDRIGSFFAAVEGNVGIYRRREEPLASLPASRQALLRKRVFASVTAFTRPGEPTAVGELVERMVLQNYAPVCVVVNERQEIVYSLGKVGRYFQHPPGPATNDVIEMAKPELREALRTLVGAPIGEGGHGLEASPRVENVDLREDGKGVPLAIHVQVLPAINGSGVLRAFVVQERSRSANEVAASNADEATLERLREELTHARDELRRVLKESQQSHEELRSSNEMLMSVNEELHSSNEELEVSQAQLQSTNEQLETVNDELKMSFEELARVSSDLRNLIQSSGVATVFLDSELRIGMFTPAARELFSFIETDRGRPITNIAQRFQYPDLAYDMLDVQRTRVIKETQVQAESRWYLMRILPYMSSPSDVRGVVITFGDITQLKLSEVEVQRLSVAMENQLKWLQTLVDVVPVGIGFHEKARDSLRVNRSAADLVGIESGAEAEGGPLKLAWNVPDAHSGSEAILHEAMTSPRPVEGLEVELGREGEERRHVLVHAAPLYDSEGNAYAKVSGLLDITESKRERQRALARGQQQAIVAELGLRALEAEDLQAFLTQSLPIICKGAGAELADLARVGDDRTHLQRVVAFGFETQGPTDEPIDGRASSGRALAQREPIVLSRDAASASDWPSHLQRENVRVGARIAIGAESSRDPFGLLGIYRRNTPEFSNEDLVFLKAIANVLTSAVQRRLIEQTRLRESHSAALREAERQIRRTERLSSLGTFASGIAHELNNPLSNIVLSSDYAAKTANAERRAKMLDTIRQNARRCGRIVESVLHFARAEVTEKWPNELNSIVRHAGELVTSYMGAERLNIAFDLREPSPLLNCNPTELEQVFVNLLRNAAQAHPDGCKVVVRSELTPKDVCVLVSDDGPGIASEDIERIFDPFFSTQRAAGGTGLGLSISHRILATHGGSIRAGTTPGSGGATFEIRLPLVQPRASAQHNEES